MIGKLFDLLFGCRHRHLSRPTTSMSSRGTPEGDAYVVCLDCGSRFAFDTREMRMGKMIRS